MKKLITTIFLLSLIATALQVQAIPFIKIKNTRFFIGIDDDLIALKKIGIAIADKDQLDKNISSKVSNIIWNTTLNKLRIYEGGIWKDASSENLLDYYTKEEVDGIVATINSVLATKANTDGSNITQSSFRTALGLGSNAYNSTAYLPLTGGAVSGYIGITGDISVSGLAEIAEANIDHLVVNSAISMSGEPTYFDDVANKGYVDNIATDKANIDGSNITQSSFRTALGLGSNAYNSTAYLPLTGGTVSGELSVSRLTNFGLSVLHGSIFMALPNTDAINPDGGTNNLINFNNGDIAFREGTDKSFNIDVYNSGVEKNSLKIHQNGDVDVNGNISANSFIGNAASATQWGGAEADFETQTGNLSSLIGFSTSGKASYWTLAQAKDWLGLNVANNTTETLQSITDRGNTTTQNLIVTGSEQREINTYLPSSYTINDIVSGSEYKWYSDVWRIGNTRSGSTPTAGFGIDLNGIRKFLISPEGNVGIGTTAPTFKLDVVGNLKVSTPNSYVLIDNVNSGENYYSASSFHSFQIAGNEKFRIANNGNIGIGTTSPDEKLTVKGKIHAEEIKVDLSVPGPDYVFEKKYDLKPLTEIQKYIQENKHLPEVPSAKQMESNGINLSEMNMLLLKKVEELTLHLIEQDQINKTQNLQIEELVRMNKLLMKHVK